MQQNRPRSVRANAQGIEKLNEAKECKRVGNSGRLSLAKIAEQVYVEHTTVKRFFRGERIYTDNAEAICKGLGLDLADIVDQLGILNGTQITLKGRVDEVKPKLDNLLDALRKDAGDQTITIRIIKEGSVIIIIDGSNEGLKRLESRFKAGELKQIAGFTVEDVRPEWEDKPVSLSQWFDNIFTIGWQTVTELLNPQQLQATARTQKLERGKLIDLRADLLSHSVVLLINLSRENDDSSTVGITLRVYPTGDEVYLPPSLKLLVLSNNEVFEEVTARSADVFMRCQFEGELGEEFTVQLVLGEAVVTENFVI
jgi:DNA-binding Xre family transcriptional regulator